MHIWDSFPHPSALPAEGWRAVPFFISPLRHTEYPLVSFTPCLPEDTFWTMWDLSIPQCSSLLLFHSEGPFWCLIFFQALGSSAGRSLGFISPPRLTSHTARMSVQSLRGSRCLTYSKYMRKVEDSSTKKRVRKLQMQWWVWWEWLLANENEVKWVWWVIGVPGL